ncbi:MAG: 16S/23S rRNA (cytidine-2'-O)-methyltransferase TlyA [Eubacteriales bacterium SKADARSKE-1]|nr:16S/23S rRNA (cytidine-2'-O)-methyltransferase TlyA [Eubacteriales bacterium SKADARSKE-1]
MVTKKRLDVLLFEKGLAQSREKARALIMSGNVYVDNQKADKPGVSYPDTVEIDVRQTSLPYVSRGGLKLEKAIKVFNIDLKDKIAMDIGASTGGFTDCMLQNGAKKVYSVDVGYGQLAWKLRNDPRVVNMERTNIRYINESLITDKIDFLSVDVSFISLCLVLPVARKLMSEKALAVCLIKPQFEAGREKVGKNGVVRDRKTHAEVIKKICSFSENEGFKVLGLDFSPVKGPKGNIEYLMYLEKSEPKGSISLIDIDNVVLNSHLVLNEGE